MLITSNDYLSSISKKSVISEGGTGNFSKLFSDFVVFKKNKWLGIIIEGDKTLKKVKKVKINSDDKVFYKVLVPVKFFKLTHSSNNSLEKDFSQVILEIEKIFKKEKPDIVFLNGCYIKPWLMLMAAKNLGLPIVVQHAGLMVMEAEIFFKRKIIKKRTLKKLINMEADFSRYATKEIFLNKFSFKRYCEKVETADKGKSIIIPLPFWKLPIKKEKKLNNGVIKIGMVGRWDAIKRHEDYLNLAKSAKKKNKDWEFYSITSIPPTKKRINLKKDYRKNINVLAPMSKSELYKFYSEMDLMILPSFFDVSPTVVLESAYMNTPTMISRGVGFIDDYKKNKLNYLITDFSNPDLAVKKVERALETPLPKKFFSELIKKHDNRKVLSQYLKLFKLIIIK